MSIKGGRAKEEEWRSGDLPVVTGRKLLVSPEGGIVWLVVCHFSMRNAFGSHWIAEHSSHVQARTADVMSQTDTLVFVFSSVMLCGFRRLLFSLDYMSAPTHCCLFHCHLTHLFSVYFYECLQYLMEAKKAQQCLESTYKQLDSVSLVLEF